MITIPPVPTGPDWPSNAEKSNSSEKEAGGISIKDGLTLWLPLLLACLLCLLIPFFVHRRRRQDALRQNNFRGMSIGGGQNVDMQFLNTNEKYSEHAVRAGTSGSLSTLMNIPDGTRERKVSAVFLNPLAGTAGVSSSALPGGDFESGVMTNPLANFDLSREQSAPALSESINPVAGLYRGREGHEQGLVEDVTEEESMDLMGWAMDSTEEATTELEKVSSALVGMIDGVNEEDISALKETMIQIQTFDLEESPNNAVEFAANSASAMEDLQQKLLASVDYKAQRAKLAARTGVVTLNPTVKDLEYALKALEGTSSLTANLHYVMEQLCQSTCASAKALEESVVPHLGVEQEARALTTSALESLQDLGELAAGSIRAAASGSYSFEQDSPAVRATLEAARAALAKLRTLYSEEDLSAMDEMQSLLDSVNRMRAQLRHVEHTVKEKVEEMTMSSELRAVLEARRAGKSWKGISKKNREEEETSVGPIPERQPRLKKDSVLNPLSGRELPSKTQKPVKRTSVINPLSGTIVKAVRHSLTKANPLAGRSSLTSKRHARQEVKRVSIIEMNPLHSASRGQEDRPPQ